MKLKELASKLGLEMRGDGEVEIVMPAPIEAAGPGTIIFVANEKYAPMLETTSASCVIVPAEFAARAKVPVLISSNPYYHFARVLEIFFPPLKPPPGIDPSARVAPSASLAEGASIGALAAIGANTRIGKNSVIHPHATIYPQVNIGDDFVCHSGVSIREGVSIGHRVTILSGAVIGADGFGFGEHEGGLFKIPQVGTVVIEDDVEIGANSTIDRATVGATILHRGVKLDDQVHIGHNCEIGEYSRFAAQVGLGGSTKIGKWCQMGGQSACADHVVLGDNVLVAAQSGIHRDVKSGTIVGGSPAYEVHIWRRYATALPRLPELMRRLRALENRVEEFLAKSAKSKT
jgi:UDP-3-O-[3-hydroxymyristoyl] glucosamine N-acyltransferase